LSVTQTLHQNGQNLIEHGPAILLTSHGWPLSFFCRM